MNWQELYDDAVERFGSTPGAQLETDLVNAYRTRPAAVQLALEKIATKYARGSVHSPWAVLRTELARDEARAHVVPDDNSERERAVHLAERYIANAGHVIPSEAELLDELFGRRARLEPWAGDELLRARMLELWRASRRVPDIVWPSHSQQAYADSGSTTRRV